MVLLHFFIIGIPAVILLVAGIGIVVGCMVASGPGHKGPPTWNFDGSRFYDEAGGGNNIGFVSAVKWAFTRKRGPWEKYTHHKPGPRPPRQVEKDKLRVTFINHATVLIQTEGVNILTDPVFSDRIGPASFGGPKRHRPPGLRFEDLPKIDLVFISHDHYDHLDLPTLRRLQKHSDPMILAGLGNSAFLRRKGLLNVKDLDWWETTSIRDRFKVTFVPARHYSMRSPVDKNKTLWGGFVVETGYSKTYFAGDTGFGPHFEKIGRQFGPFDLSLIPIGSFKPRWLMGPNHISPKEAVSAHRLLRSKCSIGVHYGTFSLADDGQHDGPRDLKRVLEEEKSYIDFRVLNFGEGTDIPLVRAAEKSHTEPGVASHVRIEEERQTLIKEVKDGDWESVSYSEKNRNGSLGDPAWILEEESRERITGRA